MKKFLSDSKMFEFDRYFKECQKNNRPFIKARKNPRDGNYLILMDLITCDYNLTSKNRNKIKDLFTRETNFSKSKNIGKSIFKDFNIDKELVWYDGILSERLDAFCENLFDLAYIGNE